MASQHAGGGHPPPQDLTHLDERGQARMVSVHHKPETARLAIAAGRIEVRPETLQRLLTGDTPKGDVLPVARLAAIQAVKRTAELIPLCHPLRITGVDVAFTPQPGALAERDVIDIRVQVTALDRTGVEMEALTAVSVAALTLYDMLKAIDSDMRITDIHLVEKRGGRSHRDEPLTPGSKEH